MREDVRARIPLLLQLGEWNPRAQTFRAFVDANAKREYGWRVGGNDLCLLLDEVDNREQPLDRDAIAQIREWLQARPNAWAVIAVRQLDGFARHFLEGTPDLEFARLGLHGMEPSQQREFARKNTWQDIAHEAVLEFIDNAERTGAQDVLGILRSPFTLRVLTLAVLREGLPENAALVLRRTLKAAYAKPVHGLIAPARASRERFVAYIANLAIGALGWPQPDPEKPDGSDEETWKERQEREREKEYYDRVAELLMVFSRPRSGAGHRGRVGSSVTSRARRSHRSPRSSPISIGCGTTNAAVSTAGSTRHCTTSSGWRPRGSTSWPCAIPVSRRLAWRTRRPSIARPPGQSASRYWR